MTRRLACSREGAGRRVAPESCSRWMQTGRAGPTNRSRTPFSCRTKTVENLRRRRVPGGFAPALDGKRRESPPVPKLLGGEREARVIALRLGPPPEGYANWSLRLLARRVVELGTVASTSDETVNRTLNETASAGARCSIG